VVAVVEIKEMQGKEYFPLKKYGMKIGSRAGALRHSYTLSSWFMLPDQGMTSFEVLSRASAFLTLWRSAPEHGSTHRALNLPKYHVLGSAHVTHPFYFPNYYPEHQYPWLQYVTEEDTLNKLELRSVLLFIVYSFVTVFYSKKLIC
jgi:hypothetical protein